MTYRQWLQGQANGGNANAQLALNTMGDDGGINQVDLDANLFGRGSPYSGALADDKATIYNNAQSQLNGLYSTYQNAGSAPVASSGSTSTKSAADIAAEQKLVQDAAERTSLKGEIAGKTQSVEDAYAGLFGDLNTLVASRDSELETQYGDQFKKAGDQYADAIPEIDTSYAALGAYDSTNRGDARAKAQKGFEDTTKTIGSNKETDKTKLGQYKKTEEAKFTTDRATARTNISRAATTNDLDALRGFRNGLETNLSGASVTKATLGTDGDARKAVSDLTKDGGRFESTINALDSIFKSSLSGSVKEAAVKAVTENSGLSDEEKQKVQVQYGNVYAEQAAL